MSALLDIQKELGVANERVALLEVALRDNPGYPAIAANLDSAVRIVKRLQSQFMEAAARVGVEVCRYRAFDDSDRTNAAPVLGAIADFQKLLSVVYGSIKYGRKLRATIAPDVAKETALQFGFAFSGSIGMVMTVRSDTNLFDDSYFGESIDAIVDMSKARNPDEITGLANRLGPGAINALYRWVHDNTEQGLGADVEWHYKGDVRASLFIQRQELKVLREAIERTSAEHIEIEQIDGTLYGADVDAGRFKFRQRGMKKMLKGTVELGAIDRDHAATIPHAYRAKIRKTTRVRFAKGTEEAKYHLLELKEIAGTAE